MGVIGGASYLTRWPRELEENRQLLTTPGIILWSVVILLLAVDLLATDIGRQIGLMELNSIGGAPMATFGFWVLVPMKLMAILVGVGSWCGEFLKIRLLVPIALATTWRYAVVHDIGILFSQ